MLSVIIVGNTSLPQKREFMCNSLGWYKNWLSMIIGHTFNNIFVKKSRVSIGFISFNSVFLKVRERMQNPHSFFFWKCNYGSTILEAFYLYNGDLKSNWFIDLIIKKNYHKMNAIGEVSILCVCVYINGL